MTYVMQALDIYGARSRNRTGTPLRAGDFKSITFYFEFISLQSEFFRITEIFSPF